MGRDVGRGVNSPMYAHMVRTKAVPAVKKLYGTRAVWQDDPATIHRTAEALEAQTSVSEKEPGSKAQLKNIISKVWREMDLDKNLCKNLVSSIPNRLQAVINVEGRQVSKEDYERLEAEE